MKNIKESFKKSFTSSKFRNGAYSTVVSIAVIIVILIINLIAGQINLKIDVSEKKMFTLTKETKDLVKSVKDDVTLYYMADKDSENSLIKQMVDQYEAVGANVKVEEKDPVLYPKFASQYTDLEVDSNSVIVVNHTQQRSKVVNYYDMLVTEIDYQTYSSNVTGIDVEGQVTSAIQYVTADNLPVVYKVVGHGEMEGNDYINTSLEKGNITTKSIETLTASEIPADCSLLLMNGPQKDFSKEEATIIQDYLKKGGNAIIFAAYTEEETPNFDNMLSQYGISLEEGFAVEGDANYCLPNNPVYMVPEIANHDITSNIMEKNLSVVIPFAKGIKVAENLPEGVNVTSLLDSSDKAFSKIDTASSSMVKGEGDIDGPFHLGVAVTSGSEETESRLAVYASSYILDESMVMYNQFANMDLLLNSIQWMSDTTPTLSIPTKSLQSTYLTINAAQFKFWSVLVIGVIPMAILGIGIVVTMKRRRG